MTVQVSTSTQPYTGNGITTVFPIPFKWLDDSHIVGTSTVGVAVTPLVQGIDYTLAGGDTEGGGEATFGTAPAPGAIVQFTRVVPITQLLNLIANDGFPAETVEQSLDKITMILQQHQDIMSGAVGAPTLGLTDAVSLGSGADVYKQAVAGVAQFRSVVGGANVTITEGADEITIASLAGGGGEVNTGSNVGTGAGVFRGKVALDLQFRRLLAGSNITLTENANDITIAGPASSGEVNTASNVGTGSAVFSSKVGVDLQFRRINAGANITITQNANDITIAGAAGTGEVNTASNIGVAGAGLFASKVGVDLRFKGLAVGAGMAQSVNATDITHAVDQAFNFTWTGTHTHNKAGSGGTTATPVFPVQINDLQNGALLNGPITELGFYLGSLDIRKTSLSASAQGAATYGNSALTIQHQVAGQSSAATANCAARFAMETTQDHAGGTGAVRTNDAVTMYLGLYNGGRGVGGFGIHLDGYHAPSTTGGGIATGGQIPTTYGFSAEMYKRGETGTVVGFHVRHQFDAALNYQNDIDYAYLASPGGPTAPDQAAARFKRGLSLGSANIGPVNIGVGLDTTFAVASAQAIYMAENQEVGWSGTQHALSAATDTRCITRWSSTAQELQIRNGGSNRLSFPTAVGATYLFDFATGSRWFSGAFTPTFIGAIKILADGGGTIYIPVCSNHP